MAKTTNHNVTLSGHLIRLSLPETQDYPALKEILNDTITMESLIPFFGKSQWSDEDVVERHERFRKAYDDGSGISWVVVSLKEKNIVGHCGLKNIDRKKSEAEIGIILHQSVWGKGYSIECNFLLLKYAFENLKLNRIFFNTDEYNHKAKKFLTKMGIQFARKTKENFLQYEVLQKDWPSISSRLEKIISKHKNLT